MVMESYFCHSPALRFRKCVVVLSLILSLVSIHTTAGRATIDVGQEASGPGDILSINCGRIADGVRLMNVTRSVSITGCNITTTALPAIDIASGLAENAVLYLTDADVHATFETDPAPGTILLNSATIGSNAGLVLSRTIVSLHTQRPNAAGILVSASVTIVNPNFRLMITNASQIRVTGGGELTGIRIMAQVVQSYFQVHVTGNSNVSVSSSGSDSRCIRLLTTTNIANDASFTVEDSTLEVTATSSAIVLHMGDGVRFADRAAFLFRNSTITAVTTSGLAVGLLLAGTTFREGAQFHVQNTTITATTEGDNAVGFKMTELPTFGARLNITVSGGSRITATSATDAFAFGAKYNAGEGSTLAFIDSILEGSSATYTAAAIGMAGTVRGAITIERCELTFSATARDGRINPNRPAGGIMFYEGMMFNQVDLTVRDTVVTAKGTRMHIGSTYCQLPRGVTRNSTLVLSDVRFVGISSNISGVSVANAVSGEDVPPGTKLCLHLVFRGGVQVVTAPLYHLACRVIVNVTALAVTGYDEAGSAVLEPTVNVPCSMVERGVEFVDVASDVVVDQCQIDIVDEAAVLINEGIGPNVSVVLSRSKVTSVFGKNAQPAGRLAAIVLSGSMGAGSGVMLRSTSVQVDTEREFVATLWLDTALRSDDAFSLRSVASNFSIACAANCIAIALDSTFGPNTSVSLWRSNVRADASETFASALRLAHVTFGRSANITVDESSLDAVAEKAAITVYCIHCTFGPEATIALLSSVVVARATSNNSYGLSMITGSAGASSVVLLRQASVTATARRQARGLNLRSFWFLGGNSLLSITEHSVITAETSSATAHGLILFNATAADGFAMVITDARIVATGAGAVIAVNMKDVTLRNSSISMRRSSLLLSSTADVATAASGAIICSSTTAFMDTSLDIHDTLLDASNATVPEAAALFVLWPGTVTGRSPQQLVNVALENAANVTRIFATATNAAVSPLSPLCLRNVTTDDGSVAAAPAPFQPSCQAIVDVAEEAIVDTSDGSSSLEIACDQIPFGVRLTNVTANVTIRKCTVTSVDEEAVLVVGGVAPHASITIADCHVTSTFTALASAQGGIVVSGEVGDNASVVVERTSVTAVKTASPHLEARAFSAAIFFRNDSVFGAGATIAIRHSTIGTSCLSLCAGVLFGDSITAGSQWRFALVGSNITATADGTNAIALRIERRCSIGDNAVISIVQSVLKTACRDFPTAVRFSSHTVFGAAATIAIHRTTLTATASRNRAFAFRLNSKVSFGAGLSLRFDRTNVHAVGDEQSLGIALLGPIIGADTTITLDGCNVSAMGSTETSAGLRMNTVGIIAPHFHLDIRGSEIAANGTAAVAAVRLHDTHFVDSRISVTDSTFGFRAMLPDTGQPSGGVVVSGNASFEKTTLLIRSTMITALEETPLTAYASFVVWPMHIEGASPQMLNSVSFVNRVPESLAVFNNSVDISSWAPLCIRNVTWDGSPFTAGRLSFLISCQTFINVNEEVSNPGNDGKHYSIDCARIPFGVRLFDVTANVTIDGCVIDAVRDEGVYLLHGMPVPHTALVVSNTNVTASSSIAGFRVRGTFADGTSLILIRSAVVSPNTWFYSPGFVYFDAISAGDNFSLLVQETSVALSASGQTVGIALEKCIFGAGSTIDLSSCSVKVSSAQADSAGVAVTSSFQAGSTIHISNTTLNIVGSTGVSGVACRGDFETAGNVSLILHNNTINATSVTASATAVSVSRELQQPRSAAMLSIDVLDTTATASSSSGSGAAAAVDITTPLGYGASIRIMNSTLRGQTRGTTAAAFVLSTVARDATPQLRIESSVLEAQPGSTGVAFWMRDSNWSGAVTVRDSELRTATKGAMMLWELTSFQNVAMLVEGTQLVTVEGRQSVLDIRGIVWPANMIYSSQILKDVDIMLPRNKLTEDALVVPSSGVVENSTLCLNNVVVRRLDTPGAARASVPPAFTVDTTCRPLTPTATLRLSRSTVTVSPSVSVSCSSTMSVTHSAADPTRSPTEPTRSQTDPTRSPTIEPPRTATILLTPPPETPRPAAVPAQAKEAADVASGVASIGGVVSPLTAVVAVRGAVMARASDCGEPEAPMPDWPTLAAPLGWLFSTGDWGVMGPDIGAVLGNGLVLIIPVLVMLLVGEAVHLLTERGVFESAELVLKYGGDVLVTLTIALLSPSMGATVAILAVGGLDRPDLPVSAGNTAFAVLTLLFVSLVCAATVLLLLWGWRAGVDVEGSRPATSQDGGIDHNTKFSLDGLRRVTARGAAQAALGSGEWRPLPSLTPLRSAGFLLWLALVGDGRVPHERTTAPSALLAPFHKLWRYGGWWVAIVELSVSVLHGIAAGLARAGHCTVGPWMALVTQVLYVGVLLTVPLAPVALWAVLFFVQGMQLLSLALGFLEIGDAADSVADAADIIDVALPFFMLLVPVIVAAARILRCTTRLKRQRRALLAEPLLDADGKGEERLLEDDLEEMLPLPEQALAFEVDHKSPHSSDVHADGEIADFAELNNVGLAEGVADDVSDDLLAMLSEDTPVDPLGKDDSEPLLDDLEQLLGLSQTSNAPAEPVVGEIKVECDSYDDDGAASDDDLQQQGARAQEDNSAAGFEGMSARHRAVDEDGSGGPSRFADESCKEYSERQRRAARAAARAAGPASRYGAIAAHDPYLANAVPERIGLEDRRVSRSGVAGSASKIQITNGPVSVLDDADAGAAEAEDGEATVVFVDPQS